MFSRKKLLDKSLKKELCEKCSFCVISPYRLAEIRDNSFLERILNMQYSCGVVLESTFVRGRQVVEVRILGLVVRESVVFVFCL